MRIVLPRETLDRMSVNDLAVVGREPSTIRSLDSLNVSLLPMDTDEIKQFRGMLEHLEEVGDKKVGVLIQDTNQWLRIIEGKDTAGSRRSRGMSQFCDFLTEYFRRVPGHRIYRKTPGTNRWLCYYVNSTVYNPPVKDGDHYTPASASVELLYYRLDQLLSERLTFYREDCVRRTVAEALGEKNFFTENDDLRASYTYHKRRYDKVFGAIGTQFQTSGIGQMMQESRYRSMRETGRISMVYEGEPSKVVVDILREDGEENQASSGGRYTKINENFWKMWHLSKANDDGDSFSRFEGEVPPEEEGPIEVPIHPYIVTYDLKRHIRVQMHVDDLEDYTYNRDLDQSLVLPETTKNLVGTLVNQGRISFRDIMAGKGSGACIALGGLPGTGKTLTAEVFAEATERPLLTVQAAQLGTSPDTIEKNLTLYLRRGSRWNAVVLLDEADVYIHERGSNLGQNAIVAAFLRILETHTSTLFLTTNRLDSVDDAIISRCLARIDYTPPSVEDQHKIWRVLADINKVPLSDAEIQGIVHKNSDLTGRDIKQMLKLSSLWSSAQGETVNPDTIAWVRQFLPTRKQIKEVDNEN